MKLFPAITLLFIFSSLYVHADEHSQIRFQIVSPHKTVLSSYISGAIDELKIASGDMFESNQILARIDCSIYEAKRKRIIAELELETAKFEVQVNLLKLGSSSHLDKALIEANIKQLEADLLIADLTIEKCTIVAPFAGSVVQRIASPFQFVDIGEPILEIIDNSELEIVMLAPSSWLNKVNVGQEFQVLIDELDQIYSAYVIRIGSYIDPASQSFTMIGKIKEGDNTLISGMSGSAKFLGIAD